MTRELFTATAFKKDLKRLRKRGKRTEKLEGIVEQLRLNEPLDPRLRPHRLSGTWSDCWECHLEGDWLLIWMESEEAVTLVRTGSHADLFE